MFADINAAVAQVAKDRGSEVKTLANLDENKGLAKVKRDAKNILSGLLERGVVIDRIIGGLDEYPIAGKEVAEWLAGEEGYDFAVISGVPHAVPMAALEGVEVFSITNGRGRSGPCESSATST